MFMTHESYETYSHQKHEEDETAAAEVDDTDKNPLVEEFYRTIEAEIEEHNREYEEEAQYDNNSHRAGRILAFVKTPADFYDWFKYILDDMYGDSPTEVDIDNSDHIP